MPSADFGVPFLNFVYCLCFRGGEPGCSAVTGLSLRSAQGQPVGGPVVLTGPVQTECASRPSPD